MRVGRMGEQLSEVILSQSCIASLLCDDVGWACHADVREIVDLNRLSSGALCYVVRVQINFICTGFHVYHPS